MSLRRTGSTALERVREMLRAGERARLAERDRGKLLVDRPVPCLLVQRRALGSEGLQDDLVTGEVSHLVWSASPQHVKEGRALVELVLGELAQRFGAALFVEVWIDEALMPHDAEDGPLAPAFTLRANGRRPAGLLRGLAGRLSTVRVGPMDAEIRVERGRAAHPAELDPLLTPADAQRLGIHAVGLAVRPIWRSEDGSKRFPVVHRRLRRRLGLALRRGLHEYATQHTRFRGAHYHRFGRRTLGDAVWRVDAELAAIAGSFDYLLLVTPIDASRAWVEFKRRGFEKDPVFHYRHLPFDPSLLKRRLFRVPIETIEDPAVALLFREKQDELDRQITMLGDVGTRRFVAGSTQAFGPIDDALMREARTILDALPSRTRDDARGGPLGADELRALAEGEIARYEGEHVGFEARAIVSDEIDHGLLVSGACLHVGPDARVPAARAEALIHHEVGTHLLTHLNGRRQRLSLLAHGLARYEELQEGLATLAELLVGGLTRHRLRILAARVVAARRLTEGARFVETFRELDRHLDLERRTAFQIAMRVHRGGGLTKDAIYLRGLQRLVGMLRAGVALEPLFVGKLAFEHIALIEELKWRDVVREPAWLPSYLDREDARARLARLREGVSVLDMVKGGARAHRLRRQ